MTETVHVKGRNPGWLTQLLWFLLVGWWLGQLWMVIAWFLMATVVGMPIAISMLNSLPKIVALREPDETLRVKETVTGHVVVKEQRQYPFILRALYFLFIGIPLSAVWLEFAYVLCLTIVLMPIGFKMFDMTPTILTLKRQ